MRLQKISIKIVNIFAFVLSILLFLGTSPAKAALIPTPPLTAPIVGGSFKVDTGEVPNPLKDRVVVRQAILSLPSGESGIIKNIVIIAPTVLNPEGGRVFGCSNITVKNGIDLIKACGGPAELLPGGKLRYQAEGAGFNSSKKLTLKVKLYDNFPGDPSD